VEVQAHAKWVRTAPRKVRLVAMTLRGLPVAEALSACQFMTKGAARDVAKVIRSAQANAENNFNLAKDDLVVKDIRVQAGPMLKRGRPRAMGRYFSIFKRTSHITAVVEDRPGVVRRRPAPLPRAAQPSSRTAAPAAVPAAPSGKPAEEATTSEGVTEETTKKKASKKAPAKAPVKATSKKDEPKKDTKEKKSK
jgi:large subunit ribosomal protein L22